MWGGLFEKGKELGSKAKGFVQQIGDEIAQQNNNANVNPFFVPAKKPAAAATTATNITNADQKQQQPLAASFWSSNQISDKSPMSFWSSNSIGESNKADASEAADAGEDDRLKSQLENLNRHLKKLQTTQAELLEKSSTVSEELQKKLQVTVSQIVNENSNKFIGKVKQLLISRIAQKITAQIEDILGSELTEEHRNALSQIFADNDSDISIFDAEYNTDSLQTHFYSSIELDQMKESFSVLERANAEMKKIVDEQELFLKNERQQKLEALKANEAELVTVKQVNSELALKLKEDSIRFEKDLQNAVEQAAASIKALEADKTQLEKDLDDAFDINKVLEKDIYKLRMAAEAIQAQVTVVQGESNTKDLEDEIAALKERLQQSVSEVEQSNQRFDALSSDVVRIGSEKNELEGQIVGLKAEVKALSNKQSELENGRETVMREKSVVEEEVRRLKERLEKMSEDRKQALEKQAEEFSQLKSMMDRPEGDQLTFAEIERLTSERNQVAGELEDSKNVVAELQEELLTKDAAITGLKERLAALEVQIDENGRRQVEGQREQEQISGEHRAEVAQLQGKIEQLQNEVSEKAKQAAKDTDDKQVVEQYKEECERLESKLLEVQQQLQIQLDESSGKLSEEQNLRQTTQEQLESQLIRIQAQSQDEIQSLITRSESDGVALERLKNGLSQCEEELAKSVESVSVLTKKVEQSKQHIEQLRRGNKDLLYQMIDHVSAVANDMDKVDVSKLVVGIQENIKNTNPEIMKEFSRFLSESKKCFVDQYFYTVNAVKNSEKVKYAKLSESLDKSGDEVKQLMAKVKQMEKMEKQLLDVNEIIKTQKAAQKKADEAFKDLQVDAAQKEAELTSVSDKYGQLRVKHEAISVEYAMLKEMSVKLQESVAVLSAEKSQLEEKLVESSELGGSSREKDSQIEQLEANLASLSKVHEEVERRSEALARKYDAELKKLRAENVELKEKCLETEEVRKQVEQAESVIAEKNSKIGMLEEKYNESEAEKLMIRQETNTLLNKVKGEAAKSEFLIDRRVISNILVQYFDQESSNQVKLQILDTMSSILLFSDDEKAKIGVQKQKLGFLAQQALQEKQQPKGFANKFISFLLAPDEDSTQK